MGTPPAPADLVWLVMRAQEGDRQALERVLRHAYDLLRPFAASMIRDAAAREDVLQEVLVVLYRKLRALREPRAFGGWARRIAIREIFRALRRQRRSERLYDELPHDLPAPEGDPAPPGAELMQRLPELLERVSPASRAVLALHYVDGLSLDEAAAVLDLPAGTVKSRLAYGLATLRRVLAGEEVR